MKSIKTITLVTIALFISANAMARDIVPATHPLKDQYIVVLNDEQLLNVEQFAPRGLEIAAERHELVRETADIISHEYRARRDRVFAHGLTGFSTKMNQAQARALANDPRVAYVAEDGLVQANSVTATQIEPPSWGLDRIDQEFAPLDSAYQYLVPDGSNMVHVYVLDTGIRATHFDFEGRVDQFNGFDAIRDGNGTDDCNGHGTFVAGVAGGREYGVAKDVMLHSVRVLDCSGNGTLSSVIAGIDWVTRSVTSLGHPAVANLSLGTGASDVLDNAVRASIDAGVTYVVAAGNNGDDACNYSPARVSEAITVAASTQQDLRLTSSNHGSCIDVYAPGTSIISAYNRGDDDSVSMSGTSAASPHVAGIVANVLIQDVSLTPAQLEQAVKANATQFASELDGQATELLAYSYIDLSANSDSGSEDPGTEDPGTEDPGTEDPGTEDPGTEDPGTEDPGSEDPGSNDPNPGDSTITLDFDYNCNPRNGQCIFVADAGSASDDVQRYYWDFGDGSTREHKRPTVRNNYRGISGEVTVILAVELADGSTAMTEKTIQLPF